MSNGNLKLRYRIMKSDIKTFNLCRSYIYIVNVLIIAKYHFNKPPLRFAHGI